jgi:hypothetical protein
MLVSCAECYKSDPCWGELEGISHGDHYAIWGASKDDIFIGSSYFNGREWIDTSFGLDRYTIYALWGFSPHDVYAVCGYHQVVYFDGNDWTTIGEWPDYRLLDVWGSSKNDIYAAGCRDWRYAGCPGSILLHYNGSEWKEIERFSSDRFSGVWGSSESDVFVVGGDGGILHYDGTEWTWMYHGDAELTAIWGASSEDVFAVGYSGTILHYNGNEWSEMRPEDWTILTAIYGGSGDDVYAVGSFGERVAHYDGATWSLSDSGCGCYLEDVWVSKDGYAIAVGNGGYGMGLNYTAMEYICER